MQTPDTIYLCIFEHGDFGGGHHVMKVTGSANIERERKHLLQIHPTFKIIELRPVADIAEIERAAEAVKRDPNYVPMTNADLPAKAEPAAEPDLNI